MPAPDEDRAGESGHPAEDIYARYLLDLEAGTDVPWEAVLAAHPAHAEELARIKRDGGSLDDLVAPLTEAVRQRPGTPAPVLEPGTIWADKYEIVRLIDSGGMGVVYEAIALDLNIRVALKLLKVSTAERDELLGEARDTAQTDHPHIVRVIEFDEHEGRHYFAMTFCPGGDLRKRPDLHGADPSRTDAVEIIEKIARAVHHFHVKTGRVHLDIKPGNILFDDRGEPRLTDFGITHPAGSPAPPGGTPGYMPDEQDRGLDPITVAADVYGLGATLYWCLTGTKQDGRYEPASALNSRVDRDLEVILATCLRENPEERYSSADVLANELGRWLRHQPIVYRTRGAAWAPPYRADERLRLWSRRHPVVAPLIAAVVALALSGAGGIGWNWWQLVRARAELERTQYIERIELAGRELAVNNVPRARELLEGCPVPLRGWEWRARRRECEADPLDLRAGTPSLGVAISVDGRRVAAAGLDGSVRCWSTGDGTLSWTRRTHAGPVRDVAFSPDGTRLVAAGGNAATPGDATVRVLDSATGRDRLVFTGHRVNPWRVAWSPDHRMIASAGGGQSFGKPGELLLWDSATGQLVRALPGHDGRVWGVAFSGSGTGLMASGGDDGTVRLWHIHDGASVTVFRSSAEPVFGVAFSPDDQQIAAVGGPHNLGDTGRVVLWDIASGRSRSLAGHSDEVWSAAFHPDGTRLATAGKDRTVKIWDTATGVEVLTLTDHADHARGVAWSGDTLVSTGEDGLVRVRAVGSPAKTTAGVRLPAHPARIWRAEFSRDGRFLAAGAQDGAIVVWDVAAQQITRRLTGHTGAVRDVAFSPDGRWLASASYDDTVRLWSWPEPATIRTLVDRQAGWVHAVAFRPDSAVLASASNYRVNLWRVSDGRPLSPPRAHRWIVSRACWTPAGRTLITGSWDQTVLIHPPDGRAPELLPGHGGRVQDVAVSPDGRRLATAGHDGVIAIWDLPARRRRFTIREHTGAVLGLAWTHDGRRLVSASRDQTVRLWNAESGEELSRWRGHPGLVRAVAVSPTRPLLAVVSSDATAGNITLHPLPGR